MASENQYILTAEGVHKSYGSGPGLVEVLHGLDLAVMPGEFLAIMGPSGCGKSTLMHLLGLISSPDEGIVTIDSKPVTNSNSIRTKLRRTMIGLIFQRFNLISVLNAKDNINMSLRVRGIRPDQRADELLESLGVSHVAGRKPCEMSIGEQQRVAVARALAHKPKVLLADEPTGSLDSVNGHALMEILKQTNRDDKQTIVMITHSEELAGYADRTVYMQDGLLIDHN